MDLTVCLLLFVTIIPVVLSQTPTSARVVQSPQGSIHGKLHNHPDLGVVTTYMGIPYAQPPVGQLRFKSPQPLTYDATSHHNGTMDSPACPQDTSQGLSMKSDHEFNRKTSEDCLYLNVYVPGSNPSNLPVMVWIHGGGFTSGSGAMYDGRILAGKGQVIVVTINYRLGLLGFLPTEGTESTLGLQDQIMALHWVQKMISSFGGNPNEVTIFGESAGGASVSLLSVSPRARGLFKRVIPQSGVATSPWVIIPGNAKFMMDQIATAVKDAGCQFPPMECLKYANENDMVELTKLMKITPPDIDNDVIMADFATNTGLIHPGLEFIMGTLPNEGAMSVYMSCTNMYTTVCNVYEGMDALGLRDTGLIPYTLDPDQIESVIKHYNSWYLMEVQPGHINMLAATKLGTDRGFQVPTNRTASQLDKAGFMVRVYEINSVSEYSPLPAVPWSSDAQHADELPFLFGNLVEGVDGQVSATLIKLWTDFAKGELTEARWPLFHVHHGHYLHVDDQHPQGQVRKPYFPDYKNALWRNYFQRGEFPPFITDAVVGSGPQTRPALLFSLVFTTLVLLINQFQ